MTIDSTYWQDRPVFVTGATGIVGSWLTKQLVQLGADVTIFVRDTNPRAELYRSGVIENVQVILASLTDYQRLEEAINHCEASVVFHLGAQTLVTEAYRSPLTTFDSNIRGTYNLLEACRRHADRLDAVIVASSDKAYGDVGDLPYTETMPVNGRHPYDVSKSCTDLIAAAYYHTYGLPVAVTRCGNVYGGGDLNWSRIVPGTVRSLLAGERPAVRSDGSCLRDYIFVKDVVDGYLRTAEALPRAGVPGQAFNLSTGVPHNVLQIVKAVSDVMDIWLEPDVHATAVAEIQDQYLSSEKAHEVLDWSPAYDLHAGLAETVPWYRDYLGAN